MIRSILTAVVAVLVVMGSASMTRAQAVPPSAAATAAALARGVPLHVLAAQGNPDVIVQHVTLPPSACTRLLTGVPASQVAYVQARYCSFLHYSFYANHLPIPAGEAPPTGASSSQAAASGSICCGFSYYSNDDELTDIANGILWSANEWEDGVDNGTNVYSWHNECTPGGLGVSIQACFTNVRRDGA